jgi:hypothetical protein
VKGVSVDLFAVASLSNLDISSAPVLALREGEVPVGDSVIAIQAENADFYAYYLSRRNLQVSQKKTGEPLYIGVF